MYVEACKTIHTLKFFETIKWDFAGSSNELKKLSTFLLVKGPYSSPEPLNLWWRNGVLMIVSVVFPILNINFRKPRDKQFQFLFIEDID